ncbi:MAG: FAD-binding oxidoreductase [Thalassobaculum sp.]|uniref:FAD-binding oxidoreductase n=1 Tax=Thalassobaculum sp. TaxID=2022740 RepID=UPI0032EDC38B
MTGRNAGPAVREDDGVLAWGRVHRGRHRVAAPAWPGDLAAAARASAGDTSTLARGFGRSYGDSGLNLGAGLLDMTGLDRAIAFDRATGVLRADAGLSLDAVLRLAVPAGWFLPVTPGTKFVSLGGAVANDVHGKNHHAAGCIGRHVRRMGLWRSDRGLVECGPDSESELFAATIGGLGLTGVMAWVELALIPVASSAMAVENERFEGLDDFFRLSDEGSDWPYTVAWVDTLASGARLGRGVFSRGRHAAAGPLMPHRPGGPAVPVTAPGFLLNRWTVGAFNRLYYARPGSAFRGEQPYDPFFYPLDRLRGWNRLYGPRGFYQWQGVVPPAAAREATRTLLERVARSGEASFLAVLKNFGGLESPGLLSFPAAGTTLALDFPNRGARTLALLGDLDRVVAEAGGRLYPAKDGRLPAAEFRRGYPAWRDLEKLRDPMLMSSFWRRVTQGE